MIDAVARTPDEIVARINERIDDDFFGAETWRLMCTLPWEHAASLLSDESRQRFERGEDTWQVKTHPVRAIVKYLPFAMGKAIDHRGLSANRSISHMRGLTWLLGADDKIDWGDYQNYGAPILLQIARAIGPDGTAVWAQHTTPGLERMATGLPCEDGCASGCGT